jgi:hypothetical protein
MIERMFYSREMAEAADDRILLARIASAASRHARHRLLSETEHHTAVTELAEIALGRADLLAECAGLNIGSHDGDLDEAHYLRAAQLCIDAGADAEQIPRWINEGQRRANIGRTIRARANLVP